MLKIKQFKIERWLKKLKKDVKDCERIVNDLDNEVDSLVDTRTDPEHIDP